MTALFTVITAHCFFGWCGHIVTGFDAHEVSREMQAHYEHRHDRDLYALGYPPLRQPGGEG